MKSKISSFLFSFPDANLKMLLEKKKNTAENSYFLLSRYFLPFTRQQWRTLYHVITFEGNIMICQSWTAFIACNLISWHSMLFNYILLTIKSFDDSKEDAFWKHYGKMRKPWYSLFSVLFQPYLQQLQTQSPTCGFNYPPAGLANLTITNCLLDETLNWEHVKRAK